VIARVEGVTPVCTWTRLQRWRIRLSYWKLWCSIRTCGVRGREVKEDRPKPQNIELHPVRTVLQPLPRQFCRKIEYDQIPLLARFLRSPRDKAALARSFPTHANCTDPFAGFNCVDDENMHSLATLRRRAWNLHLRELVLWVHRSPRVRGLTRFDVQATLEVEGALAH